MKPVAPYQSASFRLIAIFTLAVTGMCVIALLFQYQTAKRALEDEYFVTLKADMDGFSTLYEQRRIVSLRQAIELRSVSAGTDVVLYLEDRNGVKLAGTFDVWPQNIEANETLFELQDVQIITAKNGHPFGVAATILPGGFKMIVGRNRASVDALQSDLKNRISLLVFTIFVGSLVLGSVLVRNVLNRVNRVNVLADRVIQGEMATRLELTGRNDEFDALDQHINQMLDRLSALHRAILRVSDAIAHELRTPLNRIHQKLENLPDSMPQKVEILAEINKTIRVFDSLLDISVAEAHQGQVQGMEAVDLSCLAREIFDLYEPLSEDKKLLYRADVQPDLQIVGNRSLLAQLISNLLDNAIKYTRTQDEVELRLKTVRERVVLTVSDTGPGLPGDIGSAAFEKFVRSERDRAIEGHGLGLALVHAIATRHGAKLRLPEVKNGFAIEVSWDRFVTSKVNRD